MSKGVHVAHNKLEASPQDQRGQGGHGAIPLSAGMLLVTLGVVYGDIGTSPMYTMKSIVANNGGIGTVSEDMILGALSLVIWTMTLVTTVKYVVIAMKADNQNEGGIFALFSLVRKVAPWLILPAMIGGAALLADGILTPAVTVTTAIEGLRTIEWGHALLGDGQTNAYVPLPRCKTMYYADIDLYRYFIGREGQSVNEATMVKRLDQQFRVTRIMMESFHLYSDVESSRLRSYMMGYFTMMMAICSVLTKLSDEDCADERLKTLWSDLKAYDERMYRRARYGVVGFFTNLRGRAGDKTTLGLYRLASKIFKFN